MALKLAVVAPEATVTETGTVSRTLLLPSVTLVPPAAAHAYSDRAGADRALAETARNADQGRDEGEGTDRAMVAVWELAPSVAVTVAL